MKFSPSDENFVERITTSFHKQGIMGTIGAKLVKVAPGEVQIEFPYNEAFTQQHGFLHAGVMTTVVDSACGYCASTLMPSDSEVLTIEYKANFIAPGAGKEFLAIGRVVKPGRTITTCQGEVLAKDEKTGEYKTIIIMQATMMTVSTSIRK